MKPSNHARAVLKRFAAPCAAALLVLALPATALAAPVRLMVDPGHGGKDPGAVSGPVKEKNATLAISKMVVESAKRQGWSVAMTRKNDRFVPLEARPAKARKFKATAMVSVHSNSMGKRKTGNMTIYRGAKSKRLGRAIMDKMGPLTDYKDIGNRSDVRGLAVLRGATQPTVIVEVLSVSNREENRAVRDPKKQREAAEAIVAGVAKFHGVPYTPPTEVKNASQSAAAATATAKQTPTAETTAPASPATPDAPVDAAPVAGSEPAAQPTAETNRDGVTELARTDAADAPADAAPNAQKNAAESPRDITRNTPIGDDSWLGRIFLLLSR